MRHNFIMDSFTSLVSKLEPPPGASTAKNYELMFFSGAASVHGALMAALSTGDATKLIAALDEELRLYAKELVDDVH